MIFYLKINSKLSVYQKSKVLAVKKILDLSPSEARMICGKFIKKKNVTKSPIYTSLDVAGFMAGVVLISWQQSPAASWQVL